MSGPRPLLTSLVLALVGACVGMIVWVLAGLGLVELGLLAAFDPVGTTPRTKAAPTAVQVAEWSFPLFALVGAFLLPRLVRWLTRPSVEATLGR